AQLLLRLGEGAVGDRGLAVAHAHGPGRLHRLERFRSQIVAALPHPFAEGEALRVRWTAGRGRERLLLEVDETEIFHGSLRFMPPVRPYCEGRGALVQRREGAARMRAALGRGQAVRPDAS